MSFSLPSPTSLDDPMLGFRFGVFFMGKTGVDFPLDFRFQSVSGLSVEIQAGKLPGTESSIAGETFPLSISYPNLVLKRGMPKDSSLRNEIQESFDSFQFHPRNVLLTLLDEIAQPLKAWVFQEAYPVKWSLADFDATSNSVLIEEIQLSYHSFKPMSL